MYSTADISDYLEVDERSVRYYIEKGFLKATLVDGNYQISSGDFSNFKEHYYYSARLKNKGKWRSVDEDNLNELSRLIEYIKKGTTLEEVISMFPKLEVRVPTAEAYQRYERNKNIREDKKKGLKREALAEKYALSVKGIEKILSKETIRLELSERVAF